MRRMLVALFFALPSLLPGQETVNNASLTGRVTDPSGALLCYANVAVTSKATGATSKTQTDLSGRFRFPYLPVGDYQLDINYTGFAENKRNLTLNIGAVVDVPVTLSVGNARTEMFVDDSLNQVVIETSRSQIAETVSEQEVTDLPFNGRNFLDLALLVPGVSPTNTAANQLFAETSAVAGQGISVNSQRNFSNSFIVDGLSANDDAAGLVQTSFGLDTVREMQVVTSGGQAEFGRALGGYLNFISKSGTNGMHGTAYGFLRNKNLNAANSLSQTQLPYTQVQTGASLGGPMVHDHTFYFANFEQRQLNQTGVITITAANAAAIDTVLSAMHYSGQSLNVSTSSPATIYPNPVRASNFFGKVDQKIGDRDQLSARYSLYHVLSVNSRGAGSTSYTSAAAGLEDLDQTGAVSNIFILTSQTVNETRAQFTNSDLQAPVNDPTGPAVSIAGVAAFGTLSGSPTARHDRLYEVVDNLSHQVRTHALRVGTDFLLNDLTITFPQSIRGAYAFSSLPNFQKGVYSTFTQSFGNFVVPQINPNVGFYAQDEWKAMLRLTVNAGLRYDLQFLKAISTDTNNLSPRIGFAFAPYRNRGTVLRGSFGLFYDRVPLRALSNALQSDGNTTAINTGTFTTIALSYGQSGAPIFPNIDSGYTATTIPPNLRLSLSTMDPHLQNAYAEQTSLEVDQQLSGTSDLAISYQHVRGLHLLVSVNVNTPGCYSNVDAINLCRPNPAFGNNKQYSSSADSYYDGLSASFVQRPARWGSYRVSYTWSKAIDNVSEFFFSSPVNNFNLREDRGLSDDDQRHRLVFDATVHSPATPATTFVGKLAHGFQLGGVLQYYSPLPFNVTAGQNSVQTTALRPCAPGYVLAPAAFNTCADALPGTMISRNAGRGFDSFTVNARLSRTVALGERIKLQGIAEAFNAFNHRNNQIPNSIFGTGTYPSAPSNASFGQPTAVGDARSVALAARFSF